MSRYAHDDLTAEVKYGAPYRADWPDAHPYTVTLRYHRRRMTVPFYTGPGWNREPDVEDVMECLRSDASSVVNTAGFEEWAEELGLDPDSRRAESVYRQARRQTEELRELLGDDFERIVFPGR
jgi:hypothetical protein